MCCFLTKMAAALIYIKILAKRINLATSLWAHLIHADHDTRAELEGLLNENEAQPNFSTIK